MTSVTYFRRVNSSVLQCLKMFHFLAKRVDLLVIWMVECEQLWNPFKECQTLWQENDTFDQQIFYTWFKFFLMSKYQNKGIGYLIVSSQDHLCTYVVYWMITNLEVCSPVRRWQILIASWVPQGSRWPSLWCPRRWGSGRWTPPTWSCRGWTSVQRPCCFWKWNGSEFEIEQNWLKNQYFQVSTNFVKWWPIFLFCRFVHFWRNSSNGKCSNPRWKIFLIWCSICNNSQISFSSWKPVIVRCHDRIFFVDSKMIQILPHADITNSKRLIQCCLGKINCKTVFTGRSPGLVVKGGDSLSEGCEFKSQRQILDGHFSHLFVVRIVMFVWKDENTQKEAGVGPFLKKQVLQK